MDVNGTMLPKEDVIAFVHMGHSNMLGYGNRPSASRAYHFTDMNLRAWKFKAGNWSPALERTAGTGNNLGGPGTSLLKQALELAPRAFHLARLRPWAAPTARSSSAAGLYYDQMMARRWRSRVRSRSAPSSSCSGITERHGTAADITELSELHQPSW